MDKADDVILVLVTDGIARLLFLEDGLDALGRRIVEIEADHVRARHHDLACVQLCKREHIVDEVRLRTVDQPLAKTLLHQETDLLLRVRVLILPLHIIAEAAADVVRHRVQDPDKWTHDATEEHHRERDCEHYVLDVCNRHGFRRQLTKHDV